MRLVFSLMTLILIVIVLFFAMNNMETRVPVTLVEVEHPDVRLTFVAIIAIFIGALYTGVIAVAEGAAVRLENRRLEREVQKLENELNYLRTQPSGRARPEPDAIPRSEARPLEVARADGRRLEDRPPSAPVYEPEPDEWERDPGDDAYSGGRGV